MSQNDRRSGMPRRAMVAPVLMLIAGMAASVALWLILTHDGPAAGRHTRQGSMHWLARRAAE